MLTFSYSQLTNNLKFDQGLYDTALEHFKTSLQVRIQIGAQPDLIESSKQAITAT